MAAETGMAAAVSQAEQLVSYSVCVGDHSCECEAQQEQPQNVCKHLEAAAQLSPFSNSMRAHTAARLLEAGHVKLAGSASNGLYRARSMASSAIVFTCNLLDQYCSCPDWHRHGRACAHLIAARRLSSPAEEPQQEQGSHADAAESIKVERSFPRQEPVPGSSGCNEASLHAELRMLLGAMRGGQSRAARRGDTEKVKEMKRLCREVAAVSSSLDAAVLEELLPQLRHLAATAGNFAPAFADQRRIARVGDKRKESDRTHKPLFDRRVRRAAAAAGSPDQQQGATLMREIAASVGADSRTRVAARTLTAAATQAARGRRSSTAAAASRTAFVSNKPHGRPSVKVLSCHHLCACDSQIQILHGL